MLNVPVGYFKMNFELTLISEQQLSLFEKHILRILLRDFHFFYSIQKTNEIVSGKLKYAKIKFYSRADNEFAITYQLGCYCQCLFNYHAPKDIMGFNHGVTNDYLQKILITETT